MSKTKRLFTLYSAAVLGLFAYLIVLAVAPVQLSAQSISSGTRVAAETDSTSGTALENPFGDSNVDISKQCGKNPEPGPGGDGTYAPVIDIGCQGEGYRGDDLNPVEDMLFAFLRFLTVGVGIVAIASVVVAGIQFSTSRGDPAGTAKAIGRIGSTIGALLLYVLAWSLLNWLVPGGIFNG